MATTKPKAKLLKHMTTALRLISDGDYREALEVLLESVEIIVGDLLPAEVKPKQPKRISVGAMDSPASAAITSKPRRTRSGGGCIWGVPEPQGTL